MDNNKKPKNFNKRWNISDEPSYEEEIEKFKRRVLNIFSDIDDHVSKEGIKRFCQIMGIREKWEYVVFKGVISKNIINALECEKEEKKFYYLLETIFSLSIQESHNTNRIIYSREKLFNDLKEAINLSNINLCITSKDGEILLYPRGEAKLDEVLVDEVFSFLNSKSSKHFEDALKNYLNFSLKNAIKSAENLRRSLEEFLRFKLNNKKGLNQNITELRKKLKDGGKDTFIRNIIFVTFSSLDDYFNENSKHKDGEINEAENEFLIYQVGLLLRYINKCVN